MTVGMIMELESIMFGKQVTMNYSYLGFLIFIFYLFYRRAFLFYVSTCCYSQKIQCDCLSYMGKTT